MCHFVKLSYCHIIYTLVVKIRLYVGLIKIQSSFTFHKLKQVCKCIKLYGFTQISNYDILFVYFKLENLVRLNLCRSLTFL